MNDPVTELAIGVGLAVAFIFGMFLGGALFKDRYHDDLCIEKLNHAITAADSLVIVQEDDFCILRLNQSG